MTEAARPVDGEETEHERLERNLSELLAEVRVAMPGVQVLFAFLLAVPFQERFPDVTSTADRIVYAIALASAAIATACFVAPTAFHRLVFHRGQRVALVRLANRCAIAGLAWLALSISASTTLVAAVLLEGELAPVVTGATSLAVLGAMWLSIGLLNRRADAAARRPQGASRGSATAA